MQWIYIILFTLTLLVPQLIVPGNFGTYAHEDVESAVIFFLGMIGFSVAYFRERSYRKHLTEKKKYQREANDASRDLVHSYSYIGEVNRQLEILKSIALGMPKKEEVSEKEREKAFAVIFEAISMFSKSENATLHFVSVPEKRIEESMLIGKREPFDVSVKEFLEQKKSVVRHEKGTIIRGGRAEGGYSVFLCLEKKNGDAEDVGFLKAILAQALWLFIRTKK